MAVLHVNSISGYGTQLLTVMMASKATQAERVGVWFGLSPGSGTPWPANLIIDVPAGSDTATKPNPAPQIAHWAALLKPDDKPAHEPLAGDQPVVASRAKAEPSTPIVDSDATPGGAEGGTGGAAKRAPCGCRGGTHVRIVIEIDGGGHVAVNDGGRGPRTTPGTGGVPVRCMTNTGKTSGQKFDVELDSTPEEWTPKLDSQNVEILYDQRSVGHIETFDKDELRKTFTSKYPGKRTALSFDDTSAQYPPIAATANC